MNNKDPTKLTQEEFDKKIEHDLQVMAEIIFRRWNEMQKTVSKNNKSIINSKHYEN